MYIKTFSKYERNTQLLELIHSDICELNGILTRGGNKYLITFINDYSKHAYVYLMRPKDQAFEMFECFKTNVENQREKKIKVLQSDRDGENTYLHNFLLLVKKMVLFINQAHLIPHKKELAKRKNITLVEMTNTIILNAKQNINIWGETLLTKVVCTIEFHQKKLRHLLMNYGKEENLA